MEMVWELMPRRFSSSSTFFAVVVLPDPDGPDKNFLDYINPDSLKVLTGCKIEKCLSEIPMPEKGKNSESFQFMRQGYFCLDNKDATPDHLVFNRAVALKESFRK